MRFLLAVCVLATACGQGSSPPAASPTPEVARDPAVTDVDRPKLAPPELPAPAGEPVAEPGTLVLLATGAGLLALFRRDRPRR